MPIREYATPQHASSPVNRRSGRPARDRPSPPSPPASPRSTRGDERDPPGETRLPEFEDQDYRRLFPENRQGTNSCTRRNSEQRAGRRSHEAGSGHEKMPCRTTESRSRHRTPHSGRRTSAHRTAGSVRCASSGRPVRASGTRTSDGAATCTHRRRTRGRPVTPRVRTDPGQGAKRSRTAHETPVHRITRGRCGIECAGDAHRTTRPMSPRGAPSLTPA